MKNFFRKMNPNGFLQFYFAKIFLNNTHLQFYFGKKIFRFILQDS